MRELAENLLGRLAGWERSDRGPHRSVGKRSYKTLIWRLVGAVLVLMVLVSLTFRWEEGDGGDSLIVRVIADLVYFMWVVAILALIAAIVAAVHHQRSGTRH